MSTRPLFLLQLLEFLEEMVFATPEDLGEVKAETPEERADRAERVLTASLAGLAALTQALCKPTAMKDVSSSEAKTANSSADVPEASG